MVCAAARCAGMPLTWMTWTDPPRPSRRTAPGAWVVVEGGDDDDVTLAIIEVVEMLVAMMMMALMGM